jgi:hypothetical protein
MSAGATQQYNFLISSQTASTATVVVNATTSIAAPNTGGVSAVVSFNTTNGLSSNNCAAVDPSCNSSASWENQIFTVPTNTPISVSTSAVNVAFGIDECGYPGQCGPQFTWALANISIDIDPAFLLIDPEAQIVFSTGVDQTGPNTLPTGGQP